MHELPELGKVPADQREVMFVVELAELLDPVESVTIAQCDPQGISRVGGISEQSVVMEQIDSLVDQPTLRVNGVYVEIARHDSALAELAHVAT